MYPDKCRGSRRSWGAGRQLLSPRQKVWEEMPDLLESSPLRHYQLSALSASAPCPGSRSVFDLEWGVLSVCFLNDHRRLSKSDAFCPCPPLSLTCHKSSCFPSGVLMETTSSDKHLPWTKHESKPC